MKKSSYLTFVAFLAAHTIVHHAHADTLNNLVDDIKNNIVTVEKTGTCDKNPFLLKQNTNTPDPSNPYSYYPYSHTLTPCLPVVAQCPFGTKLLPALSRCSLKTTSSDTGTLNFLNSIDNNYVRKLSDANGWPVSKTIKSDSDLPANKQQCESQATAPGVYQPEAGYSPFCAFDLSKIETLATGEKQFFIPRSIDGSLVKLGYNDSSPKITMSELNNSANYKCYAVNIKATAVCMTAPASFNSLLKKLGLPDPYAK